MRSHASLLRLFQIGALLACAVAPVSASAQGTPAPGPAPGGGGDDGAPGAPGPGVTVITVPGPAAPPAQSYPGYLPPADFNPDAHLPPGSRSTTDTSHSSDGFEFSGARGRGGPQAVHGGSNGQFLSEGTYTPEGHNVRRGETLWEISGHYYSNPYQWPRLWSYNPQVQNPHWIYP